MSDLRNAGRVGPHRESHEPRLRAAQFVQAPTGFFEWDGTHGVINWGMDFNDSWGDCGFAAMDHANVAKLGDPTTAGSFGFPRFHDLLQAYWAYGVAQGEPGPEPDQGVDNATMLGWAYKLGLIDGYGEVGFDELDWFASQFRGAVLGLAIDGQVAIDDFNAHRPWDAMPNAADGHDTLLIKTHHGGSGELVTWGGLQAYTANFRKVNFQDAWVIFDRDDSFVDWAALEAALAEVHGTVNPIQPIPDPAPTGPTGPAAPTGPTAAPAST